MAGITYKQILNEPQVVNGLIGMSLAEFEQLYAAFELAHLMRESNLPYTRRFKKSRKRALGAGRKYRYTLRDRLLMTLFWLQAYTTYEVLGALYGLNKTTAEANIKNILDTLATMRTFRFEPPCPEVPKLHSVQEVIEAFPDLRLVLDRKEE